MQINGNWWLCDDGIVRPLITGDLLSGNGDWEITEFLVDTGADRTVINAATLAKLDLLPIGNNEGISGLGGEADSVLVSTEIRLIRETGVGVIFRGEYAAVTESAALDICVLGRDILGLFAVIVDQPNEIVCLLRQRHHYTIEQA
ncbi:MAG: retropepsin-like aspartic protease [Acidobacteriota bacterium]